MGSFRRVLPYAVVASTVAVLSVWATAWASHPGSHTHAIVLRVDSHDTSANFHFASKRGPTAGDYGVFTGVLLSMPGKQKVGTDQGVCNFVTAGKLQCDIQLNLRHRGRINITGSLTVCAVCSSKTGVNLLAVTGGTGSFSTARGWVADHPYAGGNNDHLYVHVQ